MSPLDLNKPVQTRDGHAARIICTDRKNTIYPIIGLIADLDGIERPQSYTAQGRYYTAADSLSPDDLINIPERTSRFLNVYADHSPLFHACIDGAKRNAMYKGNTVELIFEGHNLVEVIHHG